MTAVTTLTPEGDTLPLFLRNAGRIEIETAHYQTSRIAGARDTVLFSTPVTGFARPRPEAHSGCR